MHGQATHFKQVEMFGMCIQYLNMIKSMTVKGFVCKIFTHKENNVGESIHGLSP